MRPDVTPTVSLRLRACPERALQGNTARFFAPGNNLEDQPKAAASRGATGKVRPHPPLFHFECHPMNHRLLTLEQKAQNRRDRQKRNRTARREKRRGAIFDTLPLPQYVVLLAAGELNAEDVFELHYGDLRGSKHLVRKVRRETELMYEGTPTLPLVEDSELKDVERPKRRLDNAHIGPLPAWFSAPPLPVPEGHYSQREQFEMLNAFPLRSYCRYRVLEFAKKLLRLDLPTTAFVAGKSLDGGPYTEEEILSFEQAVAFKGHFEGGRQAYAVVVEQDGVAIARGDWAFFEHENLQNLLPGLNIPERLCRREYLVNLHTTEGDNPVCLDLHSIDYTPLIRCDVRPIPSVNPRWRRRPREFPDDVRDLEQERRDFEALRRFIKSLSSA